MNKLGLTKQDDEKIASHYSAGDHAFSYQELSSANEQDANEWFATGQLVAIVSEIHGGIIGYVHEEHADDITTVLNLHTINRQAKRACTACGGSGYYDSHGSPLCGACDGTGEEE